MQRNAARRVGATVVAAWLGVFTTHVAAGYQQPVGGLPQPATELGNALDTSPPSPDVAIAVFNAVQSWLRQWQTPMDPAGQQPVTGASITLRYLGAVIGRGMEISTEMTGSPGVVIAAASHALNEAKERMPVERDALLEENLKAAAGQVMLSVELAGHPVPLMINDFADAIDLVGPGLDGVAVRIGDRMQAMFPETMLVTGLDAAAALRGLVSTVSGDATLSLKKAGELREQHGVRFYRFEAIHVTQMKAGGGPEFLHRGGQVVSLASIDAAGLRKWAERLAEHLWLQRDPLGGVFGTYNPLRNTNEPPSGPEEQALVALAMLRYQRLTTKGWPPGADESLRQTQDWILSLAHHAARAEGESSPWSTPGAAALWWSVLHELRVPPIWGNGPGAGDQELVAFKARCLASLDRAVKAPEPTQPYAPIVAWSARERSHFEGLTPDLAEKYMRDVALATPPARMAATMPWLGWADVEGKAAAAFREMRAEIWQHQLKSEDLSAERRDLSGAIVFTTSRQPLPSWQAARPLTFIATMLGDPRLTSDKEVPTELARLLASLRFLRQLSVDPTQVHMYKDPARALGGVRNSLFDQRMPPEATAMTLLTVCETLASLDAIQRRQGATPKAPESEPPTPEKGGFK